MAGSIHISEARTILNSHRPVSFSAWTSRGEILEARQAVSLRYDYRTGTRNVKLLPSGEKRTIRECLIFKINDLDVYL